MAANLLYQGIFLTLVSVLFVCYLYYPRYEIVLPVHEAKAYVFDKITGKLKQCASRDIGGNYVFFCEKVPER